MEIHNYGSLRNHVGHKVVCVGYYGDKKSVAAENPEHIALECETCCQILLDCNKDDGDDGSVLSAIASPIRSQQQQLPSAEQLATVHMEEAIRRADAAFWDEIAMAYPDVFTEHYPAGAFIAWQQAMYEAVRTWIAGS